MGEPQQRIEALEGNVATQMSEALQGNASFAKRATARGKAGCEAGEPRGEVRRTQMAH